MKDLFEYLTADINDLAGELSISSQPINSNLILLRLNGFRVIIGYKSYIMDMIEGHSLDIFAKKILKNTSFSKIKNDNDVVQIGFRNRYPRSTTLVRITKRKEHSPYEVFKSFENLNNDGLVIFKDFQYFEQASYNDLKEFVENPEIEPRYDFSDAEHAKYYLLRSSSTTFLYASKKNIVNLFKQSRSSMEQNILKHNTVIKSLDDDILRLTIYLNCEYGIPQNYSIDYRPGSIGVNYAFLYSQTKEDRDRIENGIIHNQDLSEFINETDRFIGEATYFKDMSLDEFRYFILSYEYKK